MNFNKQLAPKATQFIQVKRWCSSSECTAVLDLRVSDGVELQEMIFAAVTGDFELGAEPDDGPRLFGPSNGFLDVVEVAVEIHSPLIQVASGHLQQPHLQISDTRFFPDWRAWEGRASDRRESKSTNSRKLAQNRNWFTRAIWIRVREIPLQSQV